MSFLYLMLFEFLRYFSIMLRLNKIATLLVVNSNSLLSEQMKSIETFYIQELVNVWDMGIGFGYYLWNIIDTHEYNNLLSGWTLCGHI